MATFSERISDLMLEKEIKSHELATIVGVDTTSVNSWKRGKFQMFLSNAIKLADFFECSLDYLVGRSDDVNEVSAKQCSPFYSRFIAVVEECGYSTYRLRKESPIKGAHLNKWKKGTDPLMATLIIAAEFLGVTLDYLIGRES